MRDLLYKYVHFCIAAVHTSKWNGHSAHLIVQTTGHKADRLQQGPLGKREKLFILFQLEAFEQQLTSFKFNGLFRPAASRVESVFFSLFVGCFGPARARTCRSVTFCNFEKQKNADLWCKWVELLSVAKMQTTPCAQHWLHSAETDRAVVLVWCCFTRKIEDDDSTTLLRVENADMSRSTQARLASLLSTG